MCSRTSAQVEGGNSAAFRQTTWRDSSSRKDADQRARAIAAGSATAASVPQVAMATSLNAIHSHTLTALRKRPVPSGFNQKSKRMPAVMARTFSLSSWNSARVKSAATSAFTVAVIAYVAAMPA